MDTSSGAVNKIFKKIFKFFIKKLTLQKLLIFQFILIVIFFTCLIMVITWERNTYMTESAEILSSSLMSSFSFFSLGGAKVWYPIIIIIFPIITFLFSFYYISREAKINPLEVLTSSIFPAMYLLFAIFLILFIKRLDISMVDENAINLWESQGGILMLAMIRAGIILIFGTIIVNSIVYFIRTKLDKKYYLKSAEIARRIKIYGKNLIKEGVKYIGVVERIEAGIFSLGGKPAFPTNISVNNIAAHDSVLYNDARTIKKGDVVKLDLGVHVHGRIIDTACTIEVGTDKHKKLIEASEMALKKAIEIVKPKVMVREIGAIIQKTIVSYGFSPIKNLVGHSIGIYKIHSGLNIPNYDNGDETKLKKGMVIAIEPFATTGEGKVKNGVFSEGYVLGDFKKIEDEFSKEVLEFIEDEYCGLPFCERWLIKKFGLRVRPILKDLMDKGAIRPQYQMVDTGIVSHAEHTLVVGGEVLSEPALTK